MPPRFGQCMWTLCFMALHGSSWPPCFTYTSLLVSMCGKRSQRSEPSRILWSPRLSHQQHHRSRVSLHGPLVPMKFWVFLMEKCATVWDRWVDLRMPSFVAFPLVSNKKLWLVGLLECSLSVWIRCRPSHYLLFLLHFPKCDIVSFFVVNLVVQICLFNNNNKNVYTL